MWMHVLIVIFADFPTLWRYSHFLAQAVPAHSLPYVLLIIWIVHFAYFFSEFCFNVLCLKQLVQFILHYVSTLTCLLILRITLNNFLSYYFYLFCKHYWTTAYFENICSEITPFAVPFGLCFAWNDNVQTLSTLSTRHYLSYILFSLPFSFLAHLSPFLDVWQGWYVRTAWYQRSPRSS